MVSVSPDSALRGTGASLEAAEKRGEHCDTLEPQSVQFPRQIPREEETAGSWEERAKTLRTARQIRACTRPRKGPSGPGPLARLTAESRHGLSGRSEGEINSFPGKRKPREFVPPALPISN